MTLGVVLLAMAGCGVGAVVRWALGLLRGEAVVPWPTIAANMLGTALLGAIVALDGTVEVWVTLMLGAGVAGGLTTFSTLAVDALRLWRVRRSLAVSYLALTATLGMASGVAGWHVAHALMV